MLTYVCPKPWTVEAKEVLRSVVDTRPIKFGDERNPDV